MGKLNLKYLQFAYTSVFFALASCAPATQSAELQELPKGLGEFFLEKHLWDDPIGMRKVDDSSVYSRYSGILDEECLKNISIKKDGFYFNYVDIARPQEVDQSYIYVNAAFPNERLLVSRTDVGEIYTVYLLINHTLNEKHARRLIFATFHYDSNDIKIDHNFPVRACDVIPSVY